MKREQAPTWAIVLLTALGLFSGTALISANVSIEIHQTPDAVKHGWIQSTAPPADVEEFHVVGAGPDYSTDGAIVKLWDYARAINDGEHFPTYLQEVGDCVANGAANAVNYLQAVQMVRGPPGSATEFKPAHRPFIYGVSRTDPELGNRRLRGDGSNGSWAALGCVKRGVIPADGPGVPPYSGELARQWGRTGPPQKFIDMAAEFKVRNVARVNSYEDVRDAIASGYPVTIASNQGFKMAPIVDGGKSWGKPSGTWAHQMCLIAVDDTAQGPFGGPVGGCYCLNSWGPAAHGTPADDAPPGGFWMDRRTVDRIVGQGDSWAYSNFDGFPVRDLDFQVFGDMLTALDEDLPPPEFVDKPATVPASELVGLRPNALNQAGLFGLALTLCGIGAGLVRRRPNTYHRAI